ncbi:MAG TPA: sulfotransferase family protein, partial [Mizugakiibacter sp.]|nr:sulfotransferase family protein [Mizugakiibacter sp.]
KLLGCLDEAADHFRAVLQTNPRMADAHMALADTLGTNGKTAEAIQHYRKAQKIQPDSGAPHFGLGMLAEQVNDYEEALVHCRKAVTCDPQSLLYLCATGSVLVTLGRWQEARGLYRKALRIDPRYPDALGGLARIYDQSGEYDKAAKQIEPLLRKHLYSNPGALAFLSICKHLGRCEEAVAYTEDLLRNRRDLPPRTKKNLHMATARALNHLERYDDAFTHFKAGNETIRLNYDPVGHRIMTDRLIEVFSRATLFRLPRAQAKSKRPVFIVGMPRSGTSLMEQILASHPQVDGAGELTELGDIMNTLPRELGSNQDWPHCVSDFTQDHMDRLAHRYLDKLRSVSKKARRVTDKMPHNYYLLGLIELLFPQARVIHCQRDPLDTCLSIYFQSFLDAHGYARDLFNLGTHYHQYQRLMEHWQQTLSIPILDVRYEDLVVHPESTVRAMLEFCELEWDAQCLQFHNLARRVDTASYDQVRQPLYTDSIQRWRHYEHHLDELKEGLERGH